MPKVTPMDAGIPFEDLHIPVNRNQQIHAWWIPASPPSEKVVLVFHGNGYVIEQGFAGKYHSSIEYVPLHRIGVNLLAVDYRGYGSSSPQVTTEKTTYEDARAAFNYLIAQRAVLAHNIVILGRSIGTGVATQLTTEHPEAGGLILISPFTNLNDIGKTIPYLRVLPLSLLGHSNFDNLSKIDSVHVPLLIIVGTEDNLTPLPMTHALFQKANQPKQLYLAPGVGHNHIFDIPGEKIEEQISEFLQTIH